MTDPLFISEQAKWPLDSGSTITFTMCCHCLIFYPTPGTPSESELPLQPPIMASQNTSYVSWAAGPPKSTTATSVQISKISDPHNLLSSDWRFWGVRHYTGAVADSLQESPQRTWRTQKNQDVLFSILLLINHFGGEVLAIELKLNCRIFRSRTAPQQRQLPPLRSHIVHPGVVGGSSTTLFTSMNATTC